MRTAPINLRAMPDQRDLIDYAASILGKTRSDFMLETACQVCPKCDFRSYCFPIK
ncbi:DUF1778 domain-containing protein [Actinobacillus arthritidis]|uniref:type II toxin-antitoxin system TacA family antitoxin n=1 Tax=Actinobacillus arthritidis TaxID=157339 RepID=UPI002442678D|nr:DUF1778 domain-containing protein [Actinobacillus arthritidis]WGE89232.1 DUF1778 domain-containing protein [Actinobacillus arthritidis]